MRELNTIQKREKLNKVFASDEKGNGGAIAWEDTHAEITPTTKPKTI